MTYKQTFAALADPTRRTLFERLRRVEMPVGDLARAARISQPAASQHLTVLRKARLVRVRKDGTRRLYRATPDGLLELKKYIDSFWDDVLAAYAEGSPSDKEES